MLIRAREENNSRLMITIGFLLLALPRLASLILRVSLGMWAFFLREAR